MSLAYLPNLGTVRLRITTRGEDEERMQAELEDNRQQIEDIIAAGIWLRERKFGRRRRSSLTGGRLHRRHRRKLHGRALAGMLTGNAGSSAYFLGGAVAYSNPLKKIPAGRKAFHDQKTRGGK